MRVRECAFVHACHARWRVTVYEWQLPGSVNHRTARSLTKIICALGHGQERRGGRVVDSKLRGAHDAEPATLPDLANVEGLACACEHEVSLNMQLQGSILA